MTRAGKASGVAAALGVGAHCAAAGARSPRWRSGAAAAAGAVDGCRRLQPAAVVARAPASPRSRRRTRGCGGRPSTPALRRSDSGVDAAAGAQRVEHRVVVAGVDHDHHVAVVLGRRARHRRSADVDHLDHLGLGGAGAGLAQRLAERIEVHHHHVDRHDALLGELAAVRLLGAIGEDRAVDPGMQRLDAAVEDLGRAGDRGDRRHRDAALLEVAQRAAGREDLEAQLDQAARERVDAGLVRHRDERAPALLGHDRNDRSGRRLGLDSRMAHRDLSSHGDGVGKRFTATGARARARLSFTMRSESMEGRRSGSAPPASSQTKRSIEEPSVIARLNETAATPNAVERSSKTPTPELARRCADIRRR